ncbi:sodium/proline symporter PutP [Streptomyces zingiberis]|uniref:Sodium/proline symporter n=1 Tax=Streptomyces zingiberis TaxID=2053010 RepID=A0ABX1C0I5_9ACTN|nr:sodium/proline symporter PutP [Streptomyces zingiberis]NJQ02903.1 sodium/proline symporter PutP [Streptomyces zingiberis]
MFALSAPTLTVFVVYLAAVVGVGVWAYRHTRTFTDFALGGRRLRAPVAALSAGASDMSGWLFLALPGAVYAGGLDGAWIAVGGAVGTYLNWLFVAPRLRTYTERADNAVSLSAYLEERFEDRTRTIRIVTAAVTVVFFTLYVAAGLVAGGILFEHAFDSGYAVGVLLTALVIVAHSCLGGFLAVSTTHVAQATLMLVALVVVAATALTALGGFGELRSRLDDKATSLLQLGAHTDYSGGDWSSGGALGGIAIASMLAWGLGYFGQPHILARFMGIHSIRAVPAARRIGTAWVVVVLGGATLVGLAGIAVLDRPLRNPEVVYIAVTDALLSPWVAGVMLIAVLAAITSTADSQLLVSSVALTEDFFHAFLHRRARDRLLVRVGRATVVLVTLVACVLALRDGVVISLIAHAWAGFGAAFGPVVLLSLYWPRMSWAGALAGIVTGACTVLLWGRINPLLGPLESDLYELVPGFLAATVAALLFGRWAGRPPQRAFWRMPGGGVTQLMLEPALGQAPVGMAVLDTDLRYVWVNRVLERMSPLGRRLGRRVTEVLPDAEAAALEERMRGVLATGRPSLDFEFCGPGFADPQRERAYSISSFGMEDRHGQRVGIWYLVTDITDRHRARRRLALLNAVGDRISGTLDMRLTARELAAGTVPELADLTTVALLEPVLRGEEPASGPLGRLPELRRAGHAPGPGGEGQREPAGAAGGEAAGSAGREAGGEAGGTAAGDASAQDSAGEPLRAPPGSPLARCLLEGRTVVEPGDGAAVRAWLREDPVLAAFAAETGVDAVAVVPMRARGATLGAVVLVRSGRLGPFEEDDVRLAEELVSRAAVSVDNARRYTRERAAARTMQRSLLPHDLDGGSALEVASWYFPADAPSGVGGDWFDVIPLSGARVALTVGDVVGYGIDAATTMGRLRTALRTLANLDFPPDELLAHLDDLVIGLTEPQGPGGPPAGEDRVAATFLGATCLYAVYDPVAGRCTMARAGHVPPVVVHPGGRVEFVDLPAGPPLGLGALPFECAEVGLAEGSLIALYTNGLVQAASRDIDVGLSRLAAALDDPARPLRSTGDGAVAALLTGPPPDDAALLLARTRVLDSTQVASRQLPADPAVVADARTFAAGQLSAWGLDVLLFPTELIISELVTNAIRHATGPITLRLLRERTLVCEVYDASSTSPRLRHARTTDEGGRGLLIVAQLARRWGTRYTTEGKIIWAEQGLPAGDGEGGPAGPARVPV